MFADDELRHCAWTHPGKRQAKPATKLATAEHHCCSTSLLQLQQQQPLLNVTRRLQHNLKVQSQQSHRFRFGCATKIATALLGNMGGLAKKRRLVDANIRYHSPVEGIAYAKTGGLLSTGSVDDLQDKKKVKLHVEVQVMSGEKVAATFKGLYFVLPK